MYLTPDNAGRNVWGITYRSYDVVLFYDKPGVVKMHGYNVCNGCIFEVYVVCIHIAW